MSSLTFLSHPGFRRAASGGALAPEPTRATRFSPQPIRIFFFHFLSFFIFFIQLDFRKSTDARENRAGRTREKIYYIFYQRQHSQTCVLQVPGSPGNFVVLWPTLLVLSYYVSSPVRRGPRCLLSSRIFMFLGLGGMKAAFIPIPGPWRARRHDSVDVDFRVWIIIWFLLGLCITHEWLLTLSTSFNSVSLSGLCH